MDHSLYVDWIACCSGIWIIHIELAHWLKGLTGLLMPSLPSVISSQQFVFLCFKSMLSEAFTCDSHVSLIRMMMVWILNWQSRGSGKFGWQMWLSHTVINDWQIEDLAIETVRVLRVVYLYKRPVWYYLMHNYKTALMMYFTSICCCPVIC